MLTQRQLEVLADKIAGAFNNNNPRTPGIAMRGGWFPYNLDEMMAEVLSTVSPNQGTVTVAAPRVVAQGPAPITVYYDNATRSVHFRYDASRLQGNPDFNQDRGILTVHGQSAAIPPQYIVRHDVDVQAWRVSDSSNEVIVSVPVSVR